MMIILSSGIIPYSYASVESEAEEDLMAGCRDDQTLVYRFAYKDYVCVTPSTADRWVELGFAEIKQKSTSGTKDVSDVDENSTFELKYPGAPPPPPKKSTSSSDSECREGQVLIYRFSYNDTFCVNKITAITWERLGLAEIADVQKSAMINDDSKNVSEIEEEYFEENIEPTPEENIEPTTEENIEPTPEENIESTIFSYDSDLDYSDFPRMKSIDENIWFIVDYDGSRSVIIEGSDGLIVVDTLNSYKSAKKVLDEFKAFSNKPVKIIVFTMFNPNFYSSSNAFLEGGDGDVEIVMHEDLLNAYLDDFDKDIPNAVTFSSKFSIDVSGVQMILQTGDWGDSYQTYVYLPDIGGLLIGDSVDGLSPLILQMRYLQSFFE
ncbi:MAG: hypothetical protein K5777_00860 [Nitrosopumilus sp.]|nr:hypothetical protein [Nitrosopumilus sp.]